MVFEKIAEMLAEKVDMDVKEIQGDTKFADLGIDSLDITELVMEMEDAFHIEIEMDEPVATVAELVAKVEGLMQ